jgi:hypothetical protein
MPVLAAVSSGSVQAEQRDALSRFFHEDPMRASIERKLEIAPHNRLKNRRHDSSHAY